MTFLAILGYYLDCYLICNERFKTVLVVPPNGSNYPIWKVQYTMALMKNGLWGIANATEVLSNKGDDKKYIILFSEGTTDYN